MYEIANLRSRWQVRGWLTAAGLCLIMGGPGLASDDRSTQVQKADTLPPAAECGSCTRRHQALAKAKKRREQKQAIPLSKPKEDVPFPPAE